MKSILSTILGKLKLNPNNSEGNASTPFLAFGTSESELPNIKQLNDSLYEFHTPADGKAPNVEVIFFHGLQPQGGVSKAYLHTWISSDGCSSFYWPKKLLAEEFPQARIFSVSYDSCTTRGASVGRFDIYLVAENLLQGLTQNEKGHRFGCPVILVGKDIGGLVIKAICLAAHRNCNDNQSKYQSLLHDIRGILYYCTPHRGFINSCPRKFDGAMFLNLGLQDPNLARVSEEFSQLNRSTFNWKTWAINGIPGTESELNIPEGSLRDGADRYYTVSQDLYSMARPNQRTDTTYSYLSDLMKDVICGYEPSSSSKFQSSLPFAFDPNYVPMKYTIQEIDKAFEKSYIVVLHGDSGTGKSSLARYYALCFEEAMQKRNHGQSSSPAACYVNCGPKAAVADIQIEILDKCNIEMPQQDFEPFGIKETQSQKIRRLHTTFVQKLRNLDALVVLDDVWERSFLENVLVPGLKCLITTRRETLCSDPKAESIRIQPVDMEDGRRIFANYAKFENQCIPKKFQVQADELIVAVQFHPLALATLGTVLQQGEKLDAEEWMYLRRGLLAYMESEEYICTNYPRTVSAALMLVVDPEFLGADALYLLYVINLFRGPRIPESLVKSFLSSCQPKALERLHIDIKVLKALNLVQMTREPVRVLPVSIDNGQVDLGWEEEKLYSRHFHIHHLRQSFILQQKKREMDAVTGFLLGNRELDFLDNRSDHDWATVLCAVSGVSTVKKEAEQRMGRFYKWTLDVVMQDNVFADTARFVDANELLSQFLGEMLHLLPGSIEGLKSNDNLSDDLAITCTEMLWTFLIRGRIDEYSISALLKRQDSIQWTLAFLRWLVFFLVHLHVRGTWRHQLTDAKKIIRGCADPLSSLLTRSVQPRIQINILYTLNEVVLFTYTQSSNEPHNCFPDTQKILNALVNGKLLSKERGLTCKMSLNLTWTLIVVPCQAATLVNTPGFLDQLVELLAEDVTPDLQESALGHLSRIAHRPGHEKRIIFTGLAAVSSVLFSRVVPFLSQDLGDRCRSAVLLVMLLAEDRSCAEMIVNTPNCLQRLIELLAEGVALDLQEIALGTLEFIARHPRYENSIIFARLAAVMSDLLWRIIPFLSQDVGKRCGLLSVRLLQSLAREHTYAVMAINTVNCLQKLMELLAKDVTVDLQEGALWTLCSIADHRGHESSIISAAVSSDLLSRIVPFLSQDLGERCRVALRFIALVAVDQSCAVKTVSTPNCLQKLIELLTEDVTADLQEVSLGALYRIARHSSHKSSIIFAELAAVSSDLLLRIVSFLSQDLGVRCGLSLWLLQSLTEEHSFAVVAINTPNCLQKLMELLAKDVTADLQEVVLRTLCSIADHPRHESSIIFGKLAAVCSDLLSRIVPFLSQDLGERCRVALGLITFLAVDQSCAVRTISTPNCLQKLIELLTEDVTADLQEVALGALCSIARHASHKNSIIFDELAAVSSDLLSRIVPFLSQDLGGRCRLAVWLLQSLAGERNCTVKTINTPSCLQKLIELLAEDVAADLQNDASIVLGKITDHDVDLYPNLSSAFAPFTTDQEQLSVRDVIEKQMYSMQNIRPNIRAALYRIWCYRNAMREAYAVALRDINKAVELDSTDGLSWQERGILRRLLKDYDGALEDLDRALEIDVDDYECLKHRALVKFLMGNEEGASTDAERAILIKPSRVDSISYGEGCLGALSVQFMTYKLK